MRLWPASVTTAMNGRGKDWPTTPNWLLPESTLISVAPDDTADALNTAVAGTPGVDASTRLFPAPACEPRGNCTEACPCASVVTAVSLSPGCVGPKVPACPLTRKTTATFAQRRANA